MSTTPSSHPRKKPYVRNTRPMTDQDKRMLGLAEYLSHGSIEVLRAEDYAKSCSMTPILLEVTRNTADTIIPCGVSLTLARLSESEKERRKVVQISVRGDGLVIRYEWVAEKSNEFPTKTP